MACKIATTDGAAAKHKYAVRVRLGDAVSIKLRHADRL